jgi:hemolysin activation/secretion protein
MAQEASVLEAIDNERDRQQRDETKRRSLKQPAPKTTLIPAPITKPKSAKTTALCFDINTTQVDADIELLPPKSITGRLENQCIGIDAIRLLLADINRFYQQEGLITTRAYVPRQNLSLGTLHVTIKGGRLAGFAYADGSAVNYRLLDAFPTDIGELIDLRDLEQGVDNFNRPRSQAGKMQLIPGKKQGDSYLILAQQRKKPWYLTLTFDNSGYETTGANKASSSLLYDNLLGHNDILSMDLNINADDDDNTKRSRNFSLSYSIPFGNWLYSYSRSYHSYRRIIQGVNQAYLVNGHSRSDNFGFQRLMHRDQSGRFYLYGTLSLKESKNFIEHFEIRTQRRDLTILDAGFSGDDLLGGAAINYRAGVKLGLNAFNGMNDIPGPAVSESKVLHAKVTLQLPIANKDYTLKTTLAGQLTNDELSGSEQFGVGGRYDVRGFHDDSLYGNSGFYMRNEIETKPFSHDGAKTKLFVGLDGGAIKDSETVTWSEHTIAGVSTGARIELGEHISGEITLSRAIKRPDEFTGNKNQAYLSVSMSF